MKIHHVGYAVSNLDQAIIEFRSLGYCLVGDKTVDVKRHVVIQFASLNGNFVELIAPADKVSPVSEVLKKRGNGPYHICYEVEDIEAEIKKIVLNGYKVIEPPAVAPACGNKKVAFLFKVSMGILELIEKEAR